MTRTLLFAPVLLAALSACGGMTRAVGVLPNTLDDLSARTEPFRKGRDAGPGRPEERVPAPMGGF